MTDTERPSQRNQIASAPQRKTSSELLPSRVRQQLDEEVRNGCQSPTMLMLTTDEITAMEAAIEASKAMICEEGNPSAAMAMVSKILIAYPSAQMTEAKAAAMSEAYLDALSDIPTWAIEGARRRWNRGEVSGLGNANLAFAPSAPQLRLLAIEELEYEADRAKWASRMIDRYNEHLRREEHRKYWETEGVKELDELRRLDEVKKKKDYEKASRAISEETRALLTQLTGNKKYLTLGKEEYDSEKWRKYWSNFGIDRDTETSPERREDWNDLLTVWFEHEIWPGNTPNPRHPQCAIPKETVQAFADKHGWAAPRYRNA